MTNCRRHFAAALRIDAYDKLRPKQIYLLNMQRLITKLHLERYLSSKLILCIDLAISVMASLVALIIVHLLFGGDISNRFALIWLVGATAFSLLLYYVLKTYRFIIRHSTLREIAKFVLATFGKEMLLGLSVLVFARGIVGGGNTAVLLLLDFLLTLCALVVVRVMMIVAYDLIKHRLKRRSNCSRVLIYGTGDKSVALVMRLQNSPHYEVSGFLTYGPRLKNHMLAQHCVYYFESAGNVKYLRGRYDIDAILFATESEAQSEQERLLKYATDNDIKILIAPPIDEVVGGRLMKSSIREIKIEDLLGRPEIKISLDEIIADFRGKTIMVTGAAGSIGSELCRQLATFGIRKLVLFDNSETPMHNIRLELEERFPELDFSPGTSRFRLPHLSPAGGLPRRSLQACAADGGKSVRGGAGECRRFAQRSRQVSGIRRREDGDDFDRQGCESDKHHGLHQASGGDLRAVAGSCRRAGQDKGTDEIRNHALRQRSRLERIRNPSFPRTDCKGRSRNGYPPRHHPFLHDHSRSLPSGDGGCDDVHRHADIRVRHGRIGEDCASGETHDRTRRLRTRQGHQNRVYGSATGRETLRGGAFEYGEHPADLARPHPHRQGARVRLRRRPSRRRTARNPLP